MWVDWTTDNSGYKAMKISSKFTKKFISLKILISDPHLIMCSMLQSLTAYEYKWL